jgi:hypothetical protein
MRIVRRMTIPCKGILVAGKMMNLSINHVGRHVLLCGFSVERVQHDYGYDLTMAAYNRRGEFEPGSVYIQVKATDRLRTLSGGERISWPLSRRDLELWLAETYPVILIVYDGEKDQAYWLHVQSYILAGGMRELFGGDTIHVRVPVRNRLNSRAIRKIARVKNVIHNRIRTQGRDDV